MKTLHTALWVQDLDRSVAFYKKIGFEEIGRGTINDGSTVVMLNLPGDGDVATLQLMYHEIMLPISVRTGYSHITLQVDNLDAKLVELSAGGVLFLEPQRPYGEEGLTCCFIRDPDGYGIDLVEWPPGHPAGITRADFR
jgi:lactoylglutathione lyase